MLHVLSDSRVRFHLFLFVARVPIATLHPNTFTFSGTLAFQIMSHMLRSSASPDELEVVVF